MRMVDFLKAGRDCAYLRVLGLYGDRVYRLAMGLLKSRADAEEVVQEVFLKVYTRIGDLKEAKALPSWIYRTTVNAAKMRLRSMSHRREVGLEEETGGGGAGYAPPDRGRGPEETASSRERVKILRKALASLPFRYRAALVLKDLEDMSIEEVSGALGLSPGAVKSILHRARLALRSRLSSDLEEESMCEKMVRFMRALSEGRLSPKVEEDFDLHIKDCTICNAFLKTIREKTKLPSTFSCSEMPEKVRLCLIDFIKKTGF